MTDELEESSADTGGRKHDDLLVVGIGASAGGIAALRQFFANVPAASGAAYAVILHLSPDHESRLSEVLQGTTAMPVSQVQDRRAIERDHVYVIAPNASLSIADGHIVAAPLNGRDERRAPVDLFFRTLADSYGPNAVSVVLSGTGPNGSSGIKRVKERGGLVIAQDPKEAEYAHPALNPPENRARLVVRKIVAGTDAQVGQDGAEPVFFRADARALGRRTGHLP